MIIDVNKETLNETLQNNAIVVLDFWAPWCGPCKQLGPILEDLSKASSDVVIAKCNVDENPDLATEYGVMSIPSLFFFKNEEIVQSLTGLQSLETLKSTIEGLR